MWVTVGLPGSMRLLMSEMEEWQLLYRRVARVGGGEPDAGRRMLAWARAAGFARIEGSASVWFFATGEERAWWGEPWADRLTQSRFAEQAVEAGEATPEDLSRLSEAWRRWSAADDGCFLVPHGEILCWR